MLVLSMLTLWVNMVTQSSLFGHMLTLQVLNLKTVSSCTENLNAADLVDLFEGVRDAAYSIINKKGATFYGIAVALLVLLKLSLMMKMPFFHFRSSKKVNILELTECFIGQPAIVGAHGIVRPVNIPLNDAETQKMQASAKELQAIIDEAWKNPEFQAASKN